MSNRPELTQTMEDLLKDLHSGVDAMYNDVYRLVPVHRQMVHALALRVSEQYERDYYDGGGS